MDAHDGEEAEDEEEEEGRGMLWGEAGGPVEFSFSIMVVKSLKETPSLSRCRSSQLPSVRAASLCLVPVVFYTRVNNVFIFRHTQLVLQGLKIFSWPGVF